MLTRKGSNAFKGAAFVEFYDRHSHWVGWCGWCVQPDPSPVSHPTTAFSPSLVQKAICLHLSPFKGRKINVELSAGGGGKSAKRLEKLQTKNEERRKLTSKHREEKLNQKHKEAALKEMEGF